MKNSIHKTVIIDTKTKLGKDINIGPYSIIGANVQIKNHVKIHSHVNIQGHTVIDEGTEIFPFASIGTIPQDLKYHGEKSKLIIGKKNRIREHVTINPGTKGGGLITKIGNNCLFMVGSHVAHDCTLGNNVIMANNATLAGHVKVDDFAIIGGLSAVHQFVRINIIGLKRRGFYRKQIHDLRTAFRLIFSIEGTAFERLKDAIKIYKKNRVVMDIVRFIKNKSSSRAICQPKQKNNV